MTAADIEERARRLIAGFGWRERLLYQFCVEPRVAFREPTAIHDDPGERSLGSPLDGLRSEFVGFDEAIRGSRLIDYGCGEGYQAIAMAEAGAAEVVGVDINERAIAVARHLAGTRKNVSFGSSLPEGFDVAISLNSFEHLADPEASLNEIRAALRPGGRVFIAFSPPWLSP